MSKLTIPQHITHSTLFRNWLEAINGIIDEEHELYDLLDTKAPIAHATESVAFGLGSDVLYGHVRLSDEIDAALDSSSGTAATPAAVLTQTIAFSDRLDQMEAEFNANLQDLRTDLQEQIDELSSIASGHAPIYHASTDETYGTGNAILYGHLKLSSARSPNFGVDDGTAATPSAVQSAYDDAVAYVDALDVDTRFDAVIREIESAESRIDSLEGRMDSAEEDIEDIQDKMFGLETKYFSEDLQVNTSMTRYGAYVFINAEADASITMNACRASIKTFITNESEYVLSVVPGVGCTINGRGIPILLGKGCSVALLQNESDSENEVNWSVIARDSVFTNVPEIDADSIIRIDMVSDEAQVYNISSTSTLDFNLRAASANGRTEYAEKVLLFVAESANARIVYPANAVWMNAYEAPDWGHEQGETLIIKAYQIGERLFLEQKHNSHIVPGLDRELVQTS